MDICCSEQSEHLALCTLHLAPKQWGSTSLAYLAMNGKEEATNGKSKVTVWGEADARRGRVSDYYYIQAPNGQRCDIFCIRRTS